MALFLFGVGTAERFDSDGNRVFQSKTIMENSVAISATEEEIRGGQGNALQAVVFHTSKLEATMKDCMFDLNYIAEKVGSSIVIGGETLVSETVTVGSNGAVTVLGTPATIFGGLYGWYGDNKRMTFTGKTGTVEGYKSGDKVTIQYNTVNDGIQEITVNQDFVPKEGALYIRSGLYSGDPQNVTKSSKVGEVVVIIPRFQMNASTDLTMSASGASQTDLSGFALSTFDEEHPNGYYAKIQVVKNETDWTNGLVGLAVTSIDTLTTGDTLEVRGVYSGANIAPKVLTPDKLTFTGANAQGVITATSGETVKVVIKGATGNLAKVMASVTI